MFTAQKCHIPLFLNIMLLEHKQIGQGCVIPHAIFEKLFQTVLDGRSSIKIIGILLERLGKWKINNQVGRQSRLWSALQMFPATKSK